MTIGSADGPQSLRAHAPVLTGLGITAFVLVGICATSIGLLLDPLMAQFHWKNAAAATLATVYGLAAMLSGPLAGILIDRWGSRPVMVVGTLLVAAGYCGLSFSSRLVEFYAAFLAIGVGYGGAFFLASSTLIAAQMGEQKNVGMGIWMLAGSGGAAAFATGVSWSLTTFSWRSTSLASAALILAMVPVTLLLVPRHRTVPHDAGNTPIDLRAVPWPTLIEPTFLLMCAASALAAFGMSAVFYHAVPILTKAGFAAKTAGSILGASWLVSGIGSLGLGIVANRFGAANILKISLLCSAIGTLALLVSASAALGIAAAGVFILLWGATANAVNQFLPILIVDRFGPVHLGVLVGVQGAVMGIVGSFAPIVTGSLYDHYSNYAAAIMASVLATLVAVALALCLRSPRAASTPPAQAMH